MTRDELRAAAAEVAAKLPPLTPDQRDRIALILRGAK